MTPAAIYARYSSSNQRDASIEDQLRICRDYCAKNGLTVVQEFCDRALTGRTDQRPAFLQMVAAAERKAFKVLVLYAMDRLSRDKYDLIYYKRRLGKAGVSLVYVTQPIGEGAEARLMESLLEGMAAYYSENLARSVRRGLEGNALKGIVTTGFAPFGYRLTPERRLIPDPAAAPAVQLIFERYARGDSRRAIADELNAHGFRTVHKRPFTPHSLDTILRNEAYLGTYSWGTVRVDNNHAPLISRNLYDQVQRTIERTAAARARAKAKDDYLLSGKFYCAACGALMIGDSGTARNGTVHHYYTCSNRKRGKGCKAPILKKDPVEQKILAACRSALTDDAIAQIGAAAADYAQREARAADPRPVIKKQLGDTAQRINNLLAAIEQGIITPSTKQRLTDLETQRAALEEQLARADIARPVLTAAHFAAFLRPLQSLDLNDPRDRSRLINTLLNRADLLEGKKIALVLNLKTSATVNLSGSDIEDLLELTRQYPNRCAIWRGYYVMLL